LNEDGTYGASNHAVRLDIAKTNLTDIYGQKLAADLTNNVVAANDYVAPTLKNVRVLGDTGADSKTIVLTFNEKVSVDDTDNGGLEVDLKIMLQNTTPVQLTTAEYDVLADGAVTTDGTVEIVLNKADIAGKKIC
jgi:hypothetical protein